MLPTQVAISKLHIQFPSPDCPSSSLYWDHSSDTTSCAVVPLKWHHSSDVLQHSLSFSFFDPGIAQATGLTCICIALLQTTVAQVMQSTCIFINSPITTCLWANVSSLNELMNSAEFSLLLAWHDWPKMSLSPTTTPATEAVSMNSRY